MTTITPVTWRQVPLGSLGEFRNGVNFSKRDMGSGLGLINVKDIFSDSARIDFASLDKVDLASKRGIEKYFVKAGDLFFVRSSVKRDGIGLVSIAQRGSNDVVHCGFVIRFRPTSPDVHPLFLTYLLRSPLYRKIIIGLSSGAAITNISQSSLGEMLVDLPPLPIQCKIAAILSAYDDLIENNTRRITALEEMARLLYREWFVHFRFPGHKQVAMVDSSLGPIPEGWEVQKLSKLVETQYGYTESAREEEVGPKFVRGKDINKAPYIQWDTVPYCPIDESKYTKYKLFPGDILIIRMADPGKVGIVEKDVEAVFASYLIRLTIKSKQLSPYYLFYTLLADRYQGYITGASTGTTRKSASAGVITNFDTVIPDDDICQQFEDHIATVRQSLNNLLDRNANLRRTRDLLLPRLISGEIDVADLDVAVPLPSSS